MFREVAAKLLFRLAYLAAPKDFHKPLLCYPGEHIGRALVVDGGYEDGLIAIVESYLTEQYPARTAHLIDVGANIGTHSVGMGRFCASVVAFEPNPKTAAILELNLGSSG